MLTFLRGLACMCPGSLGQWVTQVACAFLCYFRRLIHPLCKLKLLHMKEPLSKSASTFNFSGKSHNNHPLWCNQPLRLNEEQKLNPFLVFYEFFQCYHLNETREIFWAWLTEVVSSPRSISNEPIDRCNQFFFYEKIEELIEAAFLISKEKFKAPSVETEGRVSKS